MRSLLWRRWWVSDQEPGREIPLGWRRYFFLGNLREGSGNGLITVKKRSRKQTDPIALTLRGGFLLEQRIEKVWSTMKNERFGETRKDLPRSTGVNYKERGRDVDQVHKNLLEMHWLACLGSDSEDVVTIGEGWFSAGLGAECQCWFYVSFKSACHRLSLCLPCRPAHLSGGFLSRKV